MYRIIPDTTVSNQIATLPTEALPHPAEVLAILELTPWNGRGLPFGEIKARFSTVVKSEEIQPGEAPVSIKIHYSDVEQLCEQIAGVISSAAEIYVAMDGLDYSGRAMRFGQEVETGLPAWLAPIAKMRIPTLHRERLAFLWDAEPPAESIAEVLERREFVEHPPSATLYPYGARPPWCRPSLITCASMAARTRA